jgi:hypothetical protein
MTHKHLSAFVALSALSLAVACSSGNGSVVPSQTGSSPDAVRAAAADASATRADAIANAKSPVKVKPATLAFTAIGKTHAKEFTIREARYKGAFRITKSCKAHVGLSETKADGPSAKIGVTPLKSIGRCVITVTDSKKNKAVVDVSVDLTTPPSPSASPSGAPSPSASPSGAPNPSVSPSTAPSPSISPSTAPSPSVSPSTSPSPTSSPALAAIVNGNFATGTLAGWAACSFAHTGAAAVNPSPPPFVYATAQPSQSPTLTTPAIASITGANGTILAPAANLNPTISATAPPLGSYVAEAGDMSSLSIGTSGICQQITPDATNHFLSFWAYEGGTEQEFKFEDQEADILDSTGATVKSTLFSELNCFYDPPAVGAGTFATSKCDPSGTATPPPGQTTLQYQGGYWVQRGPYDLTAYVGQTVTLFIGVWNDDNDAGPTSFGNGLFVGNVQLTSTNTFPSTFNARHRAAVKKKPSAFRGARAQIIHN